MIIANQTKPDQSKQTRNKIYNLAWKYQGGFLILRDYKMISYNRTKMKGKKGSPNRQFEGFHSDLRFTTALASFLLVISCVWCLRKLAVFEEDPSPRGKFLTVYGRLQFHVVLFHAVVCFVTFG